MSRATMLDLPPEEETDTIENEADGTQDLPTEVTEQPQAQPGLPDKYQGKSLEEIVQMHQEAEKALGKQGTEVGELRKVVDEYISSQQPVAPQHNVEPEDDLDYFTDPKAAVDRAIENHPAVRKAEAQSAEYRKQAALSALQARHPDMQQILQDDGFAEWIKASNIRKQLFVRADQEFDAEAADELFTLFKERRAVAQQTVDVEKQSRKNQIKAASTGGARGGGDDSRKKIYRRADIIKLMKTDPDRYLALSDEIMSAYQEGRVK